MGRASVAAARLLAGALLLAAGPAARADTAATPAGGAPAEGGLVERSVVKVFSSVRAPDPLKPWSKQAPSEATGSGVVIEGRRILTNAHVVAYASEVQVQGYQAGDKVAARVVAAAPGIDLALLALDDESFFETHPPLARATTLPDVKEPVMAYGYPTGGSNLSITKGIVSRIEFTEYNLQVSGLRIQIDAAINPGNSGGPAVAGDRMIGLAFSTLGGAQNIGYIIPDEEIDLFLKDVADGQYDGKPAMFDELQTLENPALRTFLKLDKAVQGMVVHRPFGDEKANPLRTWDVITRIGDTPVDDQGMVRIGPNLRVRFRYLVQHLARGGQVPLTVVRGGKTLALQVPVGPTYPLLVTNLKHGYPPYFILGPLVFTVGSFQLLAAGGRMSSPVTGSPLVTRVMSPPDFPGQELVVVAAPFLPHKVAKGYSSAQLSVLKSVNGVAVKNLRHLVELLRDARDEFLVFDFDRRGGEKLVFARKELEGATEELLVDNGIRSQASPELLEVWRARR